MPESIRHLKHFAQFLANYLVARACLLLLAFIANTASAYDPAPTTYEWAENYQHGMAGCTKPDALEACKNYWTTVCYWGPYRGDPGTQSIADTTISPTWKYCTSSTRGYVYINRATLACQGGSFLYNDECVCPTGQRYDDNIKHCTANNSNLTIVLLGLATIQPGNSIPLQAKVTDSNGQPYAGAIVHLRVDAVPQSGGHLHGDDNAVERRGTLSGIGPEITPTTGANGIAGFTFDGTAVSGILKFTAWCENRTCSQQGPNMMDVKIEGLEPLPASPGLYGLIGSYPDGNNSPHPGNHYLTPAAIENAQWLAIIYATEYPSAPRLLYNDASLEWGGVFDLRKNWYTPHVEHQRGTVIDVKANHTPVGIPEENYDSFEWMVKSFGGNPLYHKPGEPTPEHYHVRLMGKNQ